MLAKRGLLPEARHHLARSKELLRRLDHPWLEGLHAISSFCVLYLDMDYPGAEHDGVEVADVVGRQQRSPRPGDVLGAGPRDGQVEGPQADEAGGLSKRSFDLVGALFGFIYVPAAGWGLYLAWYLPFAALMVARLRHFGRLVAREGATPRVLHRIAVLSALTSWLAPASVPLFEKKLRFSFPGVTRATSAPSSAAGLLMYSADVCVTLSIWS